MAHTRKKGYRTTYELLVNDNPFLNFETKKDAEEFLKERKKTQLKGAKTKIKTKKSRNYRLGDMWRSDFDYEGMVKKGTMAKVSWGKNKLQKLFDSYEDVNYHEDSEKLWDALKNLEKGKRTQAEKNLEQFRKENKKTLKEWGD
jgi:hypothetical protein